MKSDRAYLLQILESVRRVEENASRGREAFMASHTLQDAVLRNLQTMSESTLRLSAEIKATQPTLDWRLIAAFRNVLVHDYLGVDLEQIWAIVRSDVPRLRDAALAMLATLDAAD